MYLKSEWERKLEANQQQQQGKSIKHYYKLLSATSITTTLTKFTSKQNIEWKQKGVGNFEL